MIQKGKQLYVAENRLCLSEQWLYLLNGESHFPPRLGCLVCICVLLLYSTIHTMYLTYSIEYGVSDKNIDFLLPCCSRPVPAFSPVRSTSTLDILCMCIHGSRELCFYSNGVILYSNLIPRAVILHRCHYAKRIPKSLKVSQNHPSAANWLVGPLFLYG